MADKLIDRTGRLLAISEPIENGLWRFTCHVCCTDMVGFQGEIARKSLEHLETMHNAHSIDGVLDADIIE